jgi:membrane fusion protein (multidrug efflux system)
MAEPALKLMPNAPAAAEQVAKPSRGRRGTLRMMLLVVLPLLALAAGFYVYLSGGRYISTDNAYVGAPKVLITPDISGKIDRVKINEGQHVNAGDELFEIDPQPFRIALTQAEAKLASVRTDFANLKANLKALTQLADLATKSVDIKRRDVERKQALVNTRTGSQADLDTANWTLMSSQRDAETALQRKAEVFNQLLGDPNLPIEKYPAYMQAQAALEQAQRDLDHTVLRAPISGTATQVDNIQLGRYVTAGTAVLSVINDTSPWVDANPKETDITYLRVGQRVTVDIDTFPDHTFTGTVIAVSPGTGAQFAILPPQNASGNWVKVVQRVPLRIGLDPDPALSRLRSGMSATVSIDTGRSRSLASLFGLTSVAKTPGTQTPAAKAPQ